MNKETRHCLHCGTPVPNTQITAENTQVQFCCNGCKTVYAIIHKHQLGTYYQLKKEADFFATAEPVTDKSNAYFFLDSDNFIKSISRENGELFIRFYLEGIHCSACIWLLEQLPKLNTNIIQSRLFMATSIIEITFKADTKPSDIAGLLASLGYEPHVIDQDDDRIKYQRKEHQKSLFRIGVAGVSAGNIMLLAIPLYVGQVDSGLYHTFRYTMLGLSMPAVFFSALPFYQSAKASLQAKQINIDLPVSIAIILGFVMSLTNLISGNEHLYFDCISIFIFLLLSVRHGLKVIHEKTAILSRLKSFLLPQAIQKETTPNHYELCPINSVEKDDRVRINTEEIIAVDGELLSETATINSAVLTGEYLPQHVKKGEIIYAGCKNTGHAIELKVEAVGKESRMGKLLEKLEEGNKPQLSDLADQIAKYFLSIVLLLSIGALVFQSSKGNFYLGFQQALALIMVACPCALALTTPLAYALSVKLALENGIFIKAAQSLEKLQKAKLFFFDKTGTLTTGQLKVGAVYVADQQTPKNWPSLVFELEKNVHHPVSYALRHFLENNYPIEEAELSEKQVTLGKGVSGIYNGELYQMQACPSNKACNSLKLTVGLFKNTHLLVSFELSDSLRSHTLATLTEIHKSGYPIKVISGDHQANVDYLQKQLPFLQGYAKQSPEDKEAHCKKEPYCVMVGDGINDALAMKSAFLSIATQGSLEASIKHCDIYISKEGIRYIVPLIQLATRCRQIIVVGLIVSLLYNFTGIILVLMGIISPLLAALLMPVSSITVLLITVMGIQEKNLKK